MTTTSAISTVRDAYYNGSSWVVGGTNGRAFGPVDMKYVVSQTRTHNGQNQTTSISGATTPTYDYNGNTTKDDTGKQYVYDAWNRIMTVKNSGGVQIEDIGPWVRSVQVETAIICGRRRRTSAWRYAG